MHEPWWEVLTEEQLQRYSSIIDSRVRLLGESYMLAVANVRDSDYAQNFVLRGPAGTCRECDAQLPDNSDILCASCSAKVGGTI